MGAAATGRTSTTGAASSMAHDDMHVVMCKIMDYVIRRNKAVRRS